MKNLLLTVMATFAYLMGMSQPALPNYSFKYTNFAETTYGTIFKQISASISEGPGRKYVVGLGDDYYQFPLPPQVALVDSNLNTIWMREGTSPNRLGKCVIDSGGKIWSVFNHADTARFTIMDQQANVLSQFKYPGYKLSYMETDSLFRVHCFLYNSNGFAHLRFSNGIVPDFQNWVASPWISSYYDYKEQETMIHSDGRIYIRSGAMAYVFDLDGNAISTLQFRNIKDGFAVFDDHSIGVVSQITYPTSYPFSVDRFVAERYSPSGSLMWRRSFQMQFPVVLDSFLENITAKTVKGSDELFVFANTVTGHYFTNCANGSRPIYCSLSGDGEYAGWGVANGNSNVFINAYYPYFTMNSGKDGSIFQFVELPSCGIWHFHSEIGLSKVNLFQHRLGCSPYPDAFVQQPAPNLANITLGSFSTSPTSLLQLPDNMSFTNTTALYGFSTTQHCQKPCANITNVHVQIGQNVQFTDIVSGYHSLTYDFGDGTTGTANDPMHHYNGSGPYTVTLIAVNDCGSDTSIVVVNPCMSPSTQLPAYHCNYTPLLFAQTSTLPADSLEWLVNGSTFGMGDSLYWTPNATGSYAVTMLFHDGPCLTATLDTVIVSNTMTATSSFSHTIGSTGNVSFNNLSSNTVLYAWDLGDGALDSTANPSHQYLTQGIYNVCLIAWGPCAADTFCQSINVAFSPEALWRQEIDSLFRGVVQNIYVEENGGIIAVGHDSIYYGNYQGFLVAMDSTGNTMLKMKFPNFSFEPMDAIRMQNGNILVVGAMWNTSPFLPSAGYMELSPTGTVIQSNYFPNQFIPSFTKVRKAEYGGYLLSGGGSRYSYYATNSGILAHLEENLQVRWAKTSNFEYLDCFQFEDSTYWAVEFPNEYTYPSMAAYDGHFFSHLDVAGNLMAEYKAFQQNPSYASAGHFKVPNQMKPKVDVYRDCEKIIISSHEQNISHPVSGNVQSNPTTVFNTSTKAYFRTYPNIRTNTYGTYEHMGGRLAQAANGNYLFGGFVNDPRSPGDRQQVFLDYNPTTGQFSNLRVGGLETVDEAINCLKRSPGGAYIAAGLIDDQLFIRKFQTNECDIPSVPPQFMTFLLTTTVLDNQTLPLISNPYTTTVNAMTPVPYTVPILPGQGQNSLACISPCPSGPVTAGFSISQNGNQVTLTSTSTPGALLSWQIQGYPCLNGNSVSFTIGCQPTEVTLIAGNGCHSSVYSQTIPGVSGPVSLPGLLSDTVGCGLTSVVVSTQGNFSSYSWSNGSTSSSISVNTSGPIWVSVQDTSSGCNYVDTAMVTLASSPVVNLSNQTVCTGNAATLDAGPGFASYAWSNGANTQSISVTATGTYSVTVTDANGCTGSDTASLSNYTPPSVSLGNQTVCTGNAATFDAGPGFASYAWSNGGNTQSISVTATGTYSVTVTDANGCTGSGTASLGNYTAPSVSLGNQTVCTGDTATFDAGPGFASYAWSNGAITQSISVTAAGTYTVTVTDANSCTATASTALSNFPLPSISLSNQSICMGDTAVFDAGPSFANYAWSNGAFTQSISVSTAGTYSVTVTDANGCTGSVNATLSNFPAPIVSLGNDTSIVSGNSITLNAGTFSSYLWSTNATSSSITVNSAGTFSVTVTDANGCTGSDTIEINLLPQPNINISYNGMTITATGSPSGMSSYAWTFGNGATGTGQTASYTYTTPGTYQVCLTVTYSNGQTATTCMMVTVPGPLAIGQPQDYVFSLSPNPSQGKLKVHIELPETACPELELIDISGKILLKYAADCQQSQDLELNLEHLSNGSYFLRMKAGNWVDTRALRLMK